MKIVYFYDNLIDNDFVLYLGAFFCSNEDPIQLILYNQTFMV